MDIEELKKTTFEVVDAHGNVYDYLIELVESVVSHKHGILITFNDGETKSCRGISVRTFMNTFAILKWFCCIHSNTIVKVEEVAYTNPAELFFKMKSSKCHSSSVKGMKRYNDMKNNNINWITDYQLDIPFPD